jgi:hypothetical protein
MVKTTEAKKNDEKETRKCRVVVQIKRINKKKIFSHTRACERGFNHTRPKGSKG